MTEGASLLLSCSNHVLINNANHLQEAHTDGRTKGFTVDVICTSFASAAFVVLVFAIIYCFHDARMDIAHGVVYSGLPPSPDTKMSKCFIRCPHAFCISRLRVGSPVPFTLYVQHNNRMPLILLFLIYLVLALNMR